MNIEYKANEYASVKKTKTDLIFIVWRRSIYEKGFRCNICGQKLIDENGNPAGTINNYDFLQCMHCRNVVADIERSVAE